MAEVGTATLVRDCVVEFVAQRIKELAGSEMRSPKCWHGSSKPWT